MPLLLAAAIAANLAAAAGPASVSDDPAAARIESFDAVLLDTMKHAKTLGMEGRVEALRPKIEDLFAFDTMAQFATGPRWSTMTPAERQAVVKAMARYTVRNFAHNFNSYGGEQIQLDPQVKTRGPDKLVMTTLASKTGAPDTLAYRMREQGGAWKVIDVYYNAVSQVTVQRSDFAATLAAGGPSALAHNIDKKTQALN